MTAALQLNIWDAASYELHRDNGKENGNYGSIKGLRRDNGKENGNYSSIYLTLGGCPLCGYSDVNLPFDPKPMKGNCNLSR